MRSSHESGVVSEPWTSLRGVNPPTVRKNAPAECRAPPPEFCSRAVKGGDRGPAARPGDGRPRWLAGLDAGLRRAAQAPGARPAPVFAPSRRQTPRAWRPGRRFPPRNRPPRRPRSFLPYGTQGLGFVAGCDEQVFAQALNSAACSPRRPPRSLRRRRNGGVVGVRPEEDRPRRGMGSENPDLTSSLESALEKPLIDPSPPRPPSFAAKRQIPRLGPAAFCAGTSESTFTRTGPGRKSALRAFCPRRGLFVHGPFGEIRRFGPAAGSKRGSSPSMEAMRVDYPSPRGPAPPIPSPHGGETKKRSSSKRGFVDHRTITKIIARWSEGHMTADENGVDRLVFGIAAARSTFFLLRGGRFLGAPT